MKILVVCQYYKPEPFRVSDYCEALVERGHSVTVITGTPNYPEGFVYDGYTGDDLGGHKDEVVNGVTVHRCRILPRKTGAIHRFLNYISFPYEAKKYIKKLEDQFDVVLVNQLSPVMMAIPAIHYKKKHNKKLVLYCLDLWPESLCSGGIKRNSIIYKIFHRLSKWIYCQCDEILVTAQDFTEYLSTEFAIEANRISYLPQYAEEIFNTENSASNTNEGKNLLFAGNIGAAQSVKTIVEAAAQLMNESVHFHIVGSGTELETCRLMAHELHADNITFHGRKPLEQMPEFYQMADAMLITLSNDPLLSLTLPGKMQSYMLAGKPIIGAINGETSRIITESNCGFCGDAENAEMLAQNIRHFLQLTEESTKQYGENAYQYCLQNFTKHLFVDILEEVLLR